MTRRSISAAWAEAPAKVNLGLVVTGRRADGYHTLDSVFLRLALHDHLEVRLAADPSGPDELARQRRPPLPDRGQPRAARRRLPCRRSTDRPLPALRFHLDKHIPTAAGLGGGSSDAAAALRLAAAVWGLAADAPPVPELAAGLGADVPFFVAGHAAARRAASARSSSRCPHREPAAGVLLVTPPERLSTAAVFAALDRDPATSRRGREPGSGAAPSTSWRTRCAPG